jgi:hypothetical protein
VWTLQPLHPRVGRWPGVFGFAFTAATSARFLPVDTGSDEVSDLRFALVRSARLIEHHELSMWAMISSAVR